MKHVSLLAQSWFAIALSAAACAPTPKTPIGYDLNSEADVRPPEKPATHESVPDDVVARSAGDVRVTRLSDGATLSGAALAREFLGFDAICAGEEHTSATEHFAELWLLDRLASEAPNLGLELGVGFEMWPNYYQGALNAYARGQLDEKKFLVRSRYKDVWGYPYAYYRPLVDRARELGLPLVALNARPRLTNQIAKVGLAGLDAKNERDLPELDLSDSEHRADFEERMKHHPGLDRENLDNFYAAQVVWDETMAESAMKWLNLHPPVRRLLVLAGQAHCQHSAIPKRLIRRGAARVAAVLLATAEIEPQARTRYDYALVVGAASGDQP